MDVKPVRWNMPEMLTVSSALGTAGVFASFFLFCLLKEYDFDEDMIRTMLLLKLIVAGHSTLCITRTEGWFWQRPWPAPLLFGATFGTAFWMRAYALVWFVFNDVVKMRAYRMMRRREVIV